MNDSQFIKIAIKFLKYSFKNINYDYLWLTPEEKQLVTKEEFVSLTYYIKNHEQTKE